MEVLGFVDRTLTRLGWSHGSHIWQGFLQLGKARLSSVATLCQLVGDEYAPVSTIGLGTRLPDTHDEKFANY